MGLKVRHSICMDIQVFWLLRWKILSNRVVNMVFPCNEIQKTAWDVLKNFDHALILREDDPLLPAVLDVYEKQGYP